MTKKEARILYDIGRPPEIAHLNGTWQVVMWKKWKWMRYDSKVIKDGKGHNVYHVFGRFDVKWGRFTVEKEAGYLKLVYKNGMIKDRLRWHPTNSNIMIGRFNQRLAGVDIVTDEPFTLTRR